MTDISVLPEKTCVLYGTALTTEKGDDEDTRAHVIPSALGGRLKPAGILSSRGNGFLNTHVDNPFVETFGHSITYLARMSRDSGSSEKTRLKDEEGNEWIFSHDKDAIEPARPTIRTQRSDESLKVEFSGAPDHLPKTFKSMGLSKQDAATALEKATVVTTASPVMTLGSGPFRSGTLSAAAWTSVALFCADKLRIRSESWATYVKSSFKKTQIAPAVRFAPGAIQFAEELGPVAHGIALWSCERNKGLYGFVQTFGGIGMIVRFSEQWSIPVRASYCVDPLTGRSAEPDFFARELAATFSTIATAVETDIRQTLRRLGECVTNEIGGTFEVR